MSRKSSRFRYSRRRSRHSRRRFSKRRFSRRKSNKHRRSFSKRKRMHGGQLSPSIHKLSDRISNTIANLRRKLSASSLYNNNSSNSSYSIYNEGGSREIPRTTHFGGYHTSRYLRKMRKH